MSEKHRHYEAFYIVKPDLSDSEVTAIAKRFKSVVEDHGGAVDHAAKWDKRKLAYPVAGYKEGNYILMNFTAGADLPAELDRLMRISDDVLRQLILVLDAPGSVIEPEPLRPRAPRGAYHEGEGRPDHRSDRSDHRGEHRPRAAAEEAPAAAAPAATAEPAPAAAPAPAPAPTPAE
jgi:small subunit ribosomal protein S6